MPLMAPQQNAWVNPQSQFANAAQGYTTSTVNPYVDYTASNAAGYTPIKRYYVPETQSKAQDEQGGGFMSPRGNSGSNMDNAFQLGKWAKNGFELPQSQFVNDIGTNLGFGAGAVTGMSAEAVAAASGNVAGAISGGSGLAAGDLGAALGSKAAGSAATFSSVLGAAGIGALAGGILGKVGGNSTGGMIGGAVGAGVGMAGGLATLGLAAGPAGAIVGGLVGGLGGGFFGGNKKPNPAGNLHDISVGADGTFTGGTFRGKHTSASTFRPNVDDFQEYVAKQVKKYNVQLNPKTRVYFGYDVNGTTFKSNKSKPYQLAIYSDDPKTRSSFTDPSTTFNWDDNKQREVAYKNAFNKMLTMNGIDPASLKVQNATGGVAGGTQIRQKTQGSFDEFMKRQRN